MRHLSIWTLKSRLVLEYWNPFTKVPFLLHTETQIQIFNKNVLKVPLRKIWEFLSVSLSLPPLSFSLLLTHMHACTHTNAHRAQFFGKKVELKLNLWRISFPLGLSLQVWDQSQTPCHSKPGTLEWCLLEASLHCNPGVAPSAVPATSCPGSPPFRTPSCSLTASPNPALLGGKELEIYGTESREGSVFFYCFWVIDPKKLLTN